MGLQESFHIGMFDNPTVLEDFLAEPNTIEHVNEFLQRNGDKILFFYTLTPNPNEVKSRTLHVSKSALSARNCLNEGGVCMYFIRYNTEQEVSLVGFEQEIFTGLVQPHVL